MNWYAIKLGRKIRCFRERAGLSQFRLGELIDSASGSLSRIENGEVNPTKESIQKIKMALKTNSIENMFIDGDYSVPATKQEALDAVKEVEQILNSNKFAYVCDERFRIWAVSRAFARFLRLDLEKIERNIGSNLLELIFYPSSVIYKILQGNTYESTAKAQVSRYKKQVPFWEIDEYSSTVIDGLLTIPYFKKIWDETEADNVDTYDNLSRRIVFNVYGVKMRMYYAREQIKSNPRFYIVVYSR